MVETISTSLIDWSRAQFALTAMYHWLFVPLTLGLGILMSIMETKYYRTGDEFWKKTAQFWQKLFGINFAIGVATGLILEFEFGTNWSNYSSFVGDIFGAPLAIEGIVAFFMEATFIAVMFFGWNKVSKGFHLASTWLTVIGATLSAFWILVANAWMQYPAGMSFNPDTLRNELVNFSAVAFSPVALNKFFHTVLSGWVTGAVFVVGVSAWFLIKKREQKFALKSMKMAAVFGVLSTLLIIWTGDGSAYQVAQKQPMKLAVMEGLYEGEQGAGLSAVGVLNVSKKTYNDGVNPFYFNFKIPKLLSFLSVREANAFVPGVKDLMEGGFVQYDGKTALSVEEKIERGKMAITALARYREAAANKDDTAKAEQLKILEDNFQYFGYGFVKNKHDLIPNVPLIYYSFRIMVGLGVLFLVIFLLTFILERKNQLEHATWLHWISVFAIPLVYIASEAGWIVAEVGRQPWTIQDILPSNAAVSHLHSSSVQITFFIFLILFTVLLIAELGILIAAIKKGPNIDTNH